MVFDLFEVKVAPNYIMGGVDIYLIRRNGEHVSLLQFDAPPVLKLVEPDGSTQEPTFTLGGHVAQQLAEALAREGFKTDRDARIEGTLEATRAHLADLRKMLELDDAKPTSDKPTRAAA